MLLRRKWGLDGASGQQQFKQKWSNILTNSKNSDASVFIVSYVSLDLTISDGTVIWRNERPSSVRLCRPVEFEFTKETPEKTMEKYQCYSEEILKLNATSVIVNRKTYEISHKLYPTTVLGFK